MPKVIEIKGNIVGDGSSWIYDWLGIPHTSPKSISKILNSLNGEDIELQINSPGGSVTAASEIYTAIKSYKGKSVGKIVGMAASAASVIAMGVQHLEMSPTAQLMIHNSSTSAEGDYRDMEHTGTFLRKVNDTIANSYKIKTGKTQEELLALMDNETWMTAEDAKELGFIDGIMFEDAEDKTEPVVFNNIGINLSALEELAQAGSIENLKKQISNERLKELEAILNNDKDIQNSSDNQNNKGVDKEMDLEKLKNEYPDIYNQILDQGKEEGVKAERERIKEIENLSLPGNDDLINRAKFETGVSASEVAIELIKAEKAKGTNYLKNLKDDIDISNIDDVEPNDTDDNTKSKAKEEVINMILAGTK